MFKSGLTKGIYESFLRSYQLDRALIDLTPFIYVDLDCGEIKLLSNLMSTNQNTGEILALAIHSEGDLEVLSTEK